MNFTHNPSNNESIKDLLAQSNKYKAIDYTELARGGEAVIYRVEHSGTDEVVAKCSL